MIEQVYMSECIKHFHEGFRSLHGLKEYTDKEAPALFVGMYNMQDLDTVKAHNGRRLIMFSGADMENAPMVKGQIVADDTQANYLRTLEDVKIANVSYRSFEDFKTVPLGDKIYCYQSSNTDGNKAKYRYDLLLKVEKRYGPSKVIRGYHPNTDEEMREIYKECAIGLQFNPFAGYTSTKELAHMGRMSVSNRKTPFTRKFTEETLFKEIDRLLDDPVTPEYVSLRARKFVNIGKYWLK